MASKLQGLRWDQHGRTRASDVLTTVHLSTDRRHVPYWVIDGIPPIDFGNSRFRLIATHSRPEALHVELPLMGGTVVACWERSVIETLWEVGIPVLVLPTLHAFVAERMELRRTKRTMNYPSLYEVS